MLPNIWPSLQECGLADDQGIQSIVIPLRCGHPSAGVWLGAACRLEKPPVWHTAPLGPVRPVDSGVVACRVVASFGCPAMPGSIIQDCNAPVAGNATLGRPPMPECSSSALRAGRLPVKTRVS